MHSSFPSGFLLCFCRFLCSRAHRHQGRRRWRAPRDAALLHGGLRVQGPPGPPVLGTAVQPAARSRVQRGFAGFRCIKGFQDAMHARHGKPRPSVVRVNAVLLGMQIEALVSRSVPCRLVAWPLAASGAVWWRGGGLQRESTASRPFALPLPKDPQGLRQSRSVHEGPRGRQQHVTRLTRVGFVRTRDVRFFLIFFKFALKK